MTAISSIMQELSLHKYNLPKVLAATSVGHFNMDPRFDSSPQESKKNRRTFAQLAEFDPNRLAVGHVEHGDAMSEICSEADIEALRSGVTPNCDILITRQPDIFLGFTTADCLAVMFSDSMRKIVGIAHAGHAGLSLEILVTTVSLLRERGASLETLMVSISPCLHAKSAVYQNLDFAQGNPNWFPHITCTEDDVFKVDLEGMAVMSLLRAGMPINHIQRSQFDTYGSYQYFSHRYSKDNNLPEGRILNVIGMPSEPL